MWSGLGFGEAETRGSAALGDDAEAIILEISEAVSASLDELHLSVKALGDAVGFGKSPQGRDLGQPGAEGRGEGEHGREVALLKNREKAQENPQDALHCQRARCLNPSSEISERDPFHAESFSKIMECQGVALRLSLKNWGMRRRGSDNGSHLKKQKSRDQR
jgi:hypothetical protein